MATETATWPIRVGGMYPVIGRSPLMFRVIGIDGDNVDFIHHDPSMTQISPEYGQMVFAADCFRVLVHPEDQSPIPALVEALKIALEVLESYKTTKVGAHQHSIERVKEALAKAGAL